MMFYWQGSTLFGVIILTAWKQFTVTASYDLLELIFPIACYDDPSIMTPLQNKDLVNIAVFQHTPLWMKMINNSTFKQKDSIICRKSFNISSLFLEKKSKVYVNVDVNPDVYYGCPFNFMLYSGDSAQPIEEIKCRTVFSKSLHWPDGNLTVAFKFYLRSVITPYSNNGTKISIQVGTCKNCFHMAIIPQAERQPIRPETYHNVLLPRSCATRACLDFRPFRYTIVLQGGSYVDQFTQTPCYIKFDFKDERRSSRIKTCLEFSWIGREKYDEDIHPFRSNMLIVLKIDGVIYMEFRSIVLEQFWCLPDNWLKWKSLITIEFKDYNCCYRTKLWAITVQSNFSSGLYYTLCDRTPYQEVLSSFLKTTTTSLSDPETSLVEQDERPILKSVILPACLCTIFVAVISVFVVCVMHRRRSRSQTRARSQTRERLAVHQNVHQGPRQSRTESNPTYGLTQMEELTPVIQEAHPTDQPSADLDLPPPYPGNEGPPPSYEEVCHILPAQSVQK